MIFTTKRRRRSKNQGKKRISRRKKPATLTNFYLTIFQIINFMLDAEKNEL